MGCGKSKPQDISSGKSFSKSRRAAKSPKASLTHTNSNNNANVNPTTVNVAAAAAAEQNYAVGKAPVVEEEEAAAAATVDAVVYDSNPDKSPAQADTSNVYVQDQEKSPVVTEESPAMVSFSKVEESPAAVSFSKVEESPVSSVGSDTKPEEESPVDLNTTKSGEESPVYTVDLDTTTKSGESPVFTLISDTKLEPTDQDLSPPMETDHRTMPESESPVYRVVSDTNSEESSPVYTLVSDTKPEETFVMPNWVDEAMDVVPETETEKPSAEDHVTSDDHVISTSNESPVHDFIMASETTPEGSPIAGAGEDQEFDVKEETAHEFDDAQTKIPAINEEEEETNAVKDDEQETTEVKGMKPDYSYEKEIKEKTGLVAEEEAN